VETNGERRKNCAAIAFRTAVERFVDMFEARAQGDAMARKKRVLRRTAGQGLKCGKPMGRRKLANRIHSLVDVKRRETWSGVADFGDTASDM
jgi:hypothetical protein